MAKIQLDLLRTDRHHEYKRPHTIIQKKVITDYAKHMEDRKLNSNETYETEYKFKVSFEPKYQMTILKKKKFKNFINDNFSGQCQQILGS